MVISAPIKKPACDEAQENVFLMLALCFSYSSLGNIYIFNIEIIFIRRKKMLYFIKYARTAFLKAKGEPD